MPLRLKTKFTLTTALLVLCVVGVISCLYVASLAKQVIRQAEERANFIAQQVFQQARHALEDAAHEGAAPASESSADRREYVRRALEQSANLTSLIESQVGYTRTIYEVNITDQRGVVLISSDNSLPGQAAPARPRLAELLAAGFVDQARALNGPHRVYEVVFPFNLGDEPFGEVRVGISTALWRHEIAPGARATAWLALAAVLLSTLLAAAVSHVSLAPLSRISVQLDRISQGQFDSPPVAQSGELGQVSTKITRIGRQLRDVREIFSALRENMQQIMSGMEDGLLLFSADGRAVLVSPAVEKFVGQPPEALLGRRAGEIFPSGHALRDALGVEGDQLAALSGREVRINGRRGPGAHVGLSVHVITEQGTAGGERIGTLVTLRDLESFERLGSELQVSERMAALGRVTAGVAHEVKNPLNSMRLWLENLRANLPAPPPGGESAPEQGAAQQAVKILDSEINRLDRVVKTFLDFTKQVELRPEDTQLSTLLEEVAETARPQIEDAGVELVTDILAGLPPARVDRGLMKQALLNLVLNACQAMEYGAAASRPKRLTIAMRQVRATAAGSGGGAAAEISVSDTGPGIPAERREKIFQLFFTTRKGGSGIGLATAFRIVQLHAGSIDFDSEEGRGTTFRITLPLPH